MRQTFAACVLFLAMALGASLPAAAQAPPPAGGQLSPEQLQQLVAPIALYPDIVVGDVLAAATYPDQVAAAAQFMQSNPGLKDSALANAVNAQTWDPSVKALCEYSTALQMMAGNLSWTSQLGDAYYNQPDDVMNAIQAMRLRAWNAGTLRTTSQQVVTRNSDGTISISPSNSDVVYVPEYDPWVCFGPAFTPWYPWWGWPAGWHVGPGLWFGISFNLGFWHPFPWAGPVWGADWHNHRVVYGHSPYVVRSPILVDHRVLHPAPAGAMRAGAPARAPEARAPEVKVQPAPKPAPLPKEQARGFTAPVARPPTGTRSSAFSGFGAGGGAVHNAAHGGASMAAPRAGGGRGRE